MFSKEEIFDKVRATLVNALSVDDEEVVPEAKVFADLGAESIDMLDIVFQLEKNFSIKVARGELVPDDLSSEFINDGVLTPAGVEELKRRLPHADVASLPANPTLDQMKDLVTVQMIVNYVTRKLAA